MPPHNQTINMEPDEISYRTTQDPDIGGKGRHNIYNDNTDPPENEERSRRSKLLNNAIHNDDDHNWAGRDYNHHNNNIDNDDKTELASLSTMDTEAFRRLRAERRKENKKKSKSTTTSSLLLSTTIANKSTSKNKVGKSSPPRRRNRISSTEQDNNCDTSTINSSSLASISNASNTTGSYYSNASNTTSSSGDTTPLRGSRRSTRSGSRNSGRSRGLPIFQTILFGMGLIMLCKMGIIELKLENSSMSFLRGSNEELKYDYTPYQEGAVPARTLNALPPDDIVSSETEEKIDALLNDEPQQEGIGGDDTRYSKVLPQDDTLGLLVDNNSQEEVVVQNSIMNDNHDAIQQNQYQQQPQPLNSIMNDNHDAIQQELQLGQTRPRNNWDDLGSQQQQVVQQEPFNNIVPQAQGQIVEADISNGQNAQLVGWFKEQQDRVMAQGQAAVTATNDIQPQQIQPAAVVQQQQASGVVSGVVGGNIDSGIMGSYIATDGQPEVMAQQQVDVSPQVPQNNGVVGGNFNSGVVGSDLSAMNSQQQQPLQELASESYFRQAVEQQNQQQQQQAFDVQQQPQEVAQQPFQNEQVVQHPIQNEGIVGGVVGGNIDSGVVGMDLNALPIQQDQVQSSSTISEKEQKVLQLQKLLAQRQQQMAEAQAAQASQQQPEVEQVMEFDSNFEPPVQPPEPEQPIETSNIYEVQEGGGEAVLQEGIDEDQNQLSNVEEETQSVQETNEAVVEEEDEVFEETQEEKEPSIGVGFGGSSRKDPFDQHNELNELRKAAMNVSNLRPPEPKRRGEDDDNPSQPVKEPEKVLVVEAPQEEEEEEEEEVKVESEEQSESVVQVQPPGGAVPYRSTIERDAQVATRRQVVIGKQAHQRGSEAFALPTGSKISLVDNDGNEVDLNAPPPIEAAQTTPLEEIDLTKSDPMGNDARVGTDNALDRYLSDEEKQQLQTLEAHPPEEQLTHAERLAKKHQLYGNSSPGVD